MSKFQIIVLCVFGLFIFAGVGSFAFFKGKSGTQAPPITIWGTLDAGLMDEGRHKLRPEARGDIRHDPC
jgi:hypothetical protein